MQKSLVAMPQRMSGRYKLVRIKARSGLVVEETPWIEEETPWFKNILTLNYFNMAFTANFGPYINGVVVGSSSSTPAENQTSLGNFIAGTNTFFSTTTDRQYTVSPRYVAHVFRFRFAEGAAAGVIREVGVITSTSSGTVANAGAVVSSRALIVDELGVPSSITVLSDEVLDIIWELRNYAIEDITGSLTIDINGTPTVYNYTMRSVAMQNSSYWTSAPPGSSSSGLPNGRLVVGTGTTPGSSSRVLNNTALADYGENPNPMTGSTGNFDSQTEAAYTTNSKTRSTVCHMSLTRGNLASPGFRSILLQYPHACHQVLFDAPILKTASELFELDFTTTWDNA